MTDRQRLLDMNQQVDDQTNRLRTIAKTANETQDTQNNIMRQLGNQREVINRNNDLNKDIKEEIKKAGKQTTSMRRRNVCIKLLLYIGIVVLFALFVAILVYKVSTLFR